MHGACNGLTRMLTRTSSAAVPRAEAQAASVPPPAEVAGIAPSAGRRVVRPPLRGTQDDLGVVGVHHDLLELELVRRRHRSSISRSWTENSRASSTPVAYNSVPATEQRFSRVPWEPCWRLRRHWYTGFMLTRSDRVVSPPLSGYLITLA